MRDNCVCNKERKNLLFMLIQCIMHSQIYFAKSSFIVNYFQCTMSLTTKEALPY